MKSETINIRVRPDVLEAFDDIVGPGNRSRIIHELMEQEIIKSGVYKKYETKNGNYQLYIKDTRNK
jgi:hypothetical protein